MNEPRHEIKGLPHNDEAERVLLGAMLLDSTNIGQVLLKLKKEDFYRRAHQLVFQGVVLLFEQDSDVDPLLLADELIKRNEMQDVGGYEFLDDLTHGIPRLPNIEYYANIVKEKSLLRKLATAGQEISNLALSGDVSSIDAIAQAENHIFDLREGEQTHGFKELRNLLPETYEQVQERSQQEGGLVGLTSGFVDFDRITNGLQKGDLIIVAARPAMGKTSFCLNMAMNAALKAKARVVIYSLEMPAGQLTMRLLGSEARVSISSLRSGQLSDEEWRQLGASVGDLSDVNIYIEDSGESTVAQMRAQLKRLKQDPGIDMVIIDYLQLMTSSSLNAQQSRVQEVSAISRGLKIMAKEMEVPVIALSQLSRAAEQRSDHRPQLSDLRESGSIEQDADMVCFLYREDYYKEKGGGSEDGAPPVPNQPPNDEFGIAELIIAKHRNGPTGKVELAFFKKFTRFDNYSDDVMDFE